MLYKSSAFCVLYTHGLGPSKPLQEHKRNNYVCAIANNVISVRDRDVSRVFV